MLNQGLTKFDQFQVSGIQTGGIRYTCQAGFTEADQATLATLLGRLTANVGPGAAARTTPPWAGLAER